VNQFDTSAPLAANQSVVRARSRKKVLLTSVCRPLGEKYGDSPSVGYELLFGQVTRAQGLFSPRANHVHFSLEYVAENLDAPTTVLQYPNRKELIRELKRDYDYIGVSFIMATFHRMKEVVALIREHSPRSTIVLGGYGTILPDEVIGEYGDHICREEGVGFMRRLLQEPEMPMPYGHPLIVSRLRVFSKEVSRTGMVFAGLGCPNGCDFCCTSYFFKRRHIRLLPTGRDIYRVIERYQEIEPGMPVVILDEDFLLNKKRALEFRDCVQEAGKPLSIFVFASIRAISQFTVTQILEMGIDGFWIGYEGTRSGYAKQSGRPVEDIFREYREHGVSILASMIVGLPYQTPEIIEEELSGLLALKPDLSQFLIYGPTPGTPFYDRIMKEGLMRREFADDPELFYRKSTGFNSVVEHPTMRQEEIESAQTHCFSEDFRMLGPSMYRSIETWLLGYLKLKDSPNPILRKKAQYFASEIRKTYPVFLAGRLLGPTSKARKWTADLQARIHRVLGPPTLSERLLSLGALGMAAWTGMTLKLGLFQHPRLIRHTFRMPEEARPARVWHRLGVKGSMGHDVEVELRPESTVWVQVKGRLGLDSAEKLAAELCEALKRTEDRLILDLRRLLHAEPRAAERFAEALRVYRDRVRVILPVTGEMAALTTLFAAYN
jgi:radical SAM superfamily enzyme YgiQ (UPF0313 family)